MYELTREQKEKKRLGADFARKLYQGEAMKSRTGTGSAGTFSYLWRKFSEFGIFTLPIPVKYGGLEEQLRDAMAGKFYSGTADIQRNIIAGFL